MSKAQEIPSALERSLGNLRHELDPLVRRRTWTQGMIYVLGEGPGYFAALRGALAMETFLRRPVLVRTPAAFEKYSIPAVEPRSLVLLVASNPSQECLQRLGSQLDAKAAALWVVTGGPIVRICDWKDAADEGEPALYDLPVQFCQNATLTLMAVVAAQILRGGEQEHNAKVERELLQLPGVVETTINQLSDASKTLGLKIREAKQVRILGGGFNFPTALHAAWRFLSETRIVALVENLEEGQAPVRAPAFDGAIPIIVSGSQSLLRERANDAANALRKAHVGVVSITDPSDRELALRSEMALMLPTANEAIGSLLALGLLEFVAGRATRLEKAPKA